MLLILPLSIPATDERNYRFEDAKRKVYVAANRLKPGIDFFTSASSAMKVSPSEITRVSTPTMSGRPWVLSWIFLSTVLMSVINTVHTDQFLESFAKPWLGSGQ